MVRPAFRAPSSQEGEAFLAKLGRIALRDREVVFRSMPLFEIRSRVGAKFPIRREFESLSTHREYRRSHASAKSHDCIPLASIKLSRTCGSEISRAPQTSFASRSRLSYRCTYLWRVVKIASGLLSDCETCSCSHPRRNISL